VKGKTVGVLGLAFKPNTDDMRDAPSLDIIPALQAAGARIKAYDPESMHEAGKMLTEVDFCDGPYHAVDGADAMVLITEWDQFRALDFDRVKEAAQIAGRRRPAQRLPTRRYGAPGLQLYQRWAPAGRTSFTITATGPITRPD
jgi:UDP-glucose 6-dehydrogenase